MVKAHKIIVNKAQTVGVILSIGLFGVMAEAKPPKTKAPPTLTVDADYGTDSGWATVVRKDTAANVGDLKVLPTLKPDSPQAQQIQKNIQERADRAESYVQRAPTSVPILTAAADQALGNGDIAKAQSRADQAVNAAATEPDPQKFAEKWPFAMNTRGQIAKATGDFPTAHAYAAEVLKKFPKDITALGLLHETAGRAKAGAAPVAAAPAPAAAPTFVRAPTPAAPIAFTPTGANIKPYLDRASTLLGMRDYRGAIDAAQRAIQLDPANPDPHMLQAAAWVALRNMSEAMLAISKVIEKLAEGDPRLPSAYNTRSLYKNKTGDYEGAAADAGEAIKRDPAMADAYYQRSVALKKLGHDAESLADIKKAAELKPSEYKNLYEISARELGEDGSATAAVRRGSALSKVWRAALDAAGGALPLGVGVAGALLVLFAAYVLFFAKGDARAWRDRWMTPSRSSEIGGSAANSIASIEGMTFENGRYFAERQIDQGGMGAIHSGRDLKLNRTVAIKRMNAELLGNPDHRRRFLKEAETVAKLRHPNIVDIYSVCDEQNQLVIVFEYVLGRNLHVLRDASPAGRMDPKFVVTILRQIALAIDYAHREGVIHRDLKPANVMIDQHGNVKVMDFGIARQLDHQRTTLTLTSVGTPLYMAPEQADGIVTKQSDVYSVGVIAYELLTGRLPFTGEGAQLDKRAGRFTAVSELMPSLPASVDPVFKKVFAPDHTQRYAPCMEFCQALDAALTPPLA